MIVKISSLADIRTRHQDKKIVLTSGSFDLLHVGHLHYLQAVKSYGDIVVVMLSGDARIKSRKDRNRPIIPENNRAQILNALRIIDYVFIDPGGIGTDSTDPVYVEINSNLKPDLYVTDGEDPRFSGIMEKSNLVILPRSDEPVSTTAIIKHIAGIAHDKIK